MTLLEKIHLRKNRGQTEQNNFHKAKKLDNFQIDYFIL